MDDLPLFMDRHAGNCQGALGIIAEEFQQIYDRNVFCLKGYNDNLALHGLSKTLPQKPQMLRGYRGPADPHGFPLIRLSREYTDGGMDSHAEGEKGVTQGKMAVAVIKSIKFIFSANVRSAVRVLPLYR